MAMDIILYILLIMIFYDFSLHLSRLFLGLEKARKIKYYWPCFLVGHEKRYNIFWTLYWGIALTLTVIYITTLSL